MLTPPSHTIHRAMGVPPGRGCAERGRFLCWVCAGSSVRGVARSDWMGANFVGQNRVRCPESATVCEACVVVMAGRPPDTLRMHSHLFDGLSWLRLTKADKTTMRAWLRRPKGAGWFAAIADSGKKHIIPWAPVNGAGSGVVLFEERVVTLGPWELVEAMEDLLTQGVRKPELERGDYGPRAWHQAAAGVQAFERAWGTKWRASGWFELGVWLAQRKDIE